jgi:putative hydrolase of the HAD superfamily
VAFPRALLIDLDDTLLDDMSNVESCWADACAAFAQRLQVSLTELQATYRRLGDAYWRDPELNRRGRLSLRAATREVVERTLAALGHPDGGLAFDLAERYRDLREERAKLFPGVIEALERLRGEGVRLGMMTNGAADAQRAKIERFGLARYFEHVVIEGEFGAGKPDRRVFETLLAALDATPGDAWAIGDNLEFDVLAPMRLGLHGIWVDAPGKGLPAGQAGCDGRDERPHRIVAAFTEIVR